MAKTLLNYTQNRELSWLKFNKRVLEEAQDISVPLLERMKFVSIFTSNLDEFFMIRVGSLLDMVMMGDNTKDSRSGMSPSEQLHAVYTAVAPLYKEREKTLEGYTKYDLIIRERTNEFSSTLRNFPVIIPDYLVEETDKFFSTIQNNGDGMDCV